MHSYHRFRSRLIITALLVTAISCAGWQASIHRIGDRTYQALNAASETADAMLITGTMTKVQRQTFAKEIMVPALTALEGAIQATLAWEEGDPIPVNVANLIGILTKAVAAIAKQFGEGSALHENLKVALNRANGLLTQVQ